MSQSTSRNSPSQSNKGGRGESSRALVATQQQENGELLVGTEEDRAFVKKAEQNESTIRQLQFQLGRVEEMRRAAVKETNLVREIRSINALTERKVVEAAAKKQGDGDDDNNNNDGVVAASSAAATPIPKRKNQLPLTDETRARIIALEDQMVIENRRTQELRAESTLVASQVEKVEKEIAAIDGQLTVAEKATGRDRSGGVAYHEANLENVIGRLKASLAKLDNEQRTTFSVTSKLTQQIDELGAELEAMSEVDRLLAESNQTLLLKTREHEMLLEEVSRQNRIANKKEKAITTFSVEKDIAEFKRLENDKRMLHVELQKSQDSRRISSRAIEVNAVALRRVEAQLSGIANALAMVFEEAARDVVASGQRAPLHPVPIRDFEDVQHSLDETRKSIAVKDKQIDEIDAEIEALERKVDILQVAQQSKQSQAYLGYRQLVRERDELRSHLYQTDVEFKGAKQRLAQENEMLERHTGQ
jgi:hypothetical protein